LISKSKNVEIIIKGFRNEEEKGLIFDSSDSNSEVSDRDATGININSNIDKKPWFIKTL
jgi:hypothetical protein